MYSKIEEFFQVFSMENSKGLAIGLDFRKTADWVGPARPNLYALYSDFISYTESMDSSQSQAEVIYVKY